MAYGAEILFLPQLQTSESDSSSHGETAYVLFLNGLKGMHLVLIVYWTVKRAVLFQDSSLCSSIRNCIVCANEANTVNKDSRKKIILD